MKHQTSDELGPLAKPIKTPWFLRLPKAILRKNGMLDVNAVSRWLAKTFSSKPLPATASTMRSKSAASVAVGIGLLAGSTPPFKPPAIHRSMISVVTESAVVGRPSGYAKLVVPFDGASGKTYEIQWNEPPEDEYVAFYLDENGNKVWPIQKQRARMEPYPEELKQQESERLVKEKAEEEWWESKQSVLALKFKMVDGSARSQKYFPA